MQTSFTIDVKHTQAKAMSAFGRTSVSADKINLSTIEGLIEFLLS